MNKKQNSLIILFVLILQIILQVLIPIQSIATDEIITIQCNDMNFYNRLVKILETKIQSKNDTEKTITMTKTNVESIAEIYLYNQDNADSSIKITDITGIENFTNLTTLYLSRNSISDISALSGLTNLTTLYLSGNSINDIGALSGLTNLTYLYLYDNNISDISALSGLTNLTRLHLTYNSISDISALSGLTNLTDLHLSYNDIEDISALSGLTNLTTLYLNGNSINDIGALSGLTNLTYLDLYNNNISDISALSGLTNLTYLSLRSNSINDISVFAGLTNLTTLYLSGSSVSDISALSGLTNLTSLYLWGNNISDISTLSGLTNLTHLSLGHNNINDISVLAVLTNLTILVLDSTSISDINVLAGLTNLTNLSLDSTSISDISALSGLTNLTSLDLSYNSISDISALSGLTNLTRLELSENSISDIGAVTGLTNLTLLHLDSNNISDISALSGLTNLTRLLLGGNKIQTTIPKNGIQEIELPQIIKAAKDSNSKIYTESEYILTNCTLSEDGTKIIVNTNEVTSASIEIQDGNADGTTFTVNVGDSTEPEIKDTTPPEAEVRYSITSPTNQNVTVTITANEEIQEINGWTLSTGKTILTKEYTQNTEETVIIKDLAGNETTKQINISNIDKTRPEVEISYSPDSLTNQNVTVTITANEEIQEINGWTLSTDKKVLTKTYSENKSETIGVTDIAGNITSQQVSINYIDKTTPKATVSYSTQNPTNQNVTVTITVDKEIQEVEGWILDESKKILTKEYTQNGGENVEIKDLAGNETEAIVQVYNIDRTAPEATVDYSTTQETNENVVAIITINEAIKVPSGWILDEENGLIYKEYDANTEETVIIKDLAGNETEVEIIINNIIKPNAENNEGEGNTNTPNTNETEGEQILIPHAGLSTIIPIIIIVAIFGTISLIKYKKYKEF